MIGRKIYLFIGLFFYFSQLYAQSVKVDSLKLQSLDSIIIKDSYHSVSISKANLSEMDIPRAIGIIGSNLIEKQKMTSITDVLKNANGIYIMGTTGGYQEEIAARGGNISSTNTFKNGIRFFNGMKIEMSGVEKIEILKGNAAIEYGNVSPGGIINIITKKPKSKFGGSVSLSKASFKDLKGQLDVYGPLNKKKNLLYRFNAALQKANSFRNFVQSDIGYLNPSLQINVSAKTTILIEADYLKSNYTPDFGAGVINYKIVDLPRDRFTGVTWGRYKAKQSVVSSKFIHEISKTKSIHFQSAFRYFQTDLFSNVRPNSIDVKSDGSWSRNIQRNQVEDRYWIQQLDFKMGFQTRKIKHQLLVGIDAEQMKTQTINYNVYKNYDQINIFNDYVNTNEAPIPTLSKNTNTINPIVRFGLYAQDFIQINKAIKLMIGGRVNKINTQSSVYTYADSSQTQSQKIENPFSPQIAFIYQPNHKTTIFSSYSNSFTINTGVDINGNNLKPSIIDQIELGLKKKWYGGKLQFNTTCYWIKNNNLAQTSLLNGNTYSNVKELAGATRSIGIEIDAKFEPLHNLNIMMGYSFNETKYTRSNIYIVGSELRYNPKNTANISFMYEVERGIFKNLNVGLILPYVGTRYAGRSTRLTVDNDLLRLIKLNDYWLADLSLGYSYKKLKLSGKVSNVFNVLNYNMHDDNSLNPISPVNFLAQATIDF